MRQAFLACLLSLLAVAAFSSAPAAYAANPASNPSPVALTPEQARRALDVLSDPKRRAQIEDTLRAVAVAGALSAKPASAAAPASAAGPASGASGTQAGALRANGLASQLSHQVVRRVEDVTDSLTHSIVALLDVSSVRAWWRAEMGSPRGRALLTRVTTTVLATLVPALVLGALVRRALKRPIDALVARNAVEVAAAPAPDGDASHEQAPAAAPGDNATDDKPGHARSERHAVRHWSLLQRLPQAVLHMVLEALPIVVFAGVAIALMSMLAGEGSPEAGVLDALIVIYTICRAIVLVGRFFFASHAPGLRLVRMSDAGAAFAQRWVVRIVTILGIGAAIAVAPQSLGLADEAHLAILKAVLLVGHVLIAIVILQCRRPVAELIRAWSRRSRSLALVGDWLADVWAGVAVFFVMALWFVWALDVRNGYRILLHHGGISVAVLIAARLAAIVCFGVLGRLFRVKDEDKDSIAYQHAYRYYPMLRRAVSAVLVVVTAGLVLRVWGIDVSRLFSAGSVGDRLMSALVTIAIAAGLALFVWEAVNVMIERRLDRWTANADFVRAARLRTLLPMLRTALFVVIALSSC
jgi:moderate conductance mechanosensitive channel